MSTSHRVRPRFGGTLLFIALFVPGGATSAEPRPSRASPADAANVTSISGANDGARSARGSSASARGLKDQSVDADPTESLSAPFGAPSHQDDGTTAGGGVVAKPDLGGVAGTDLTNRPTNRRPTDEPDGPLAPRLIDRPLADATEFVEEPLKPWEPPGFWPCDDDLDCTDGYVCNGIEYCEKGWCQEGENLECWSDDPCFKKGDCHPTKGCAPDYVPEAYPGCCFSDLMCDDGNLCNGIDSCDPVMQVCHVEPPTPCNDGNPCNGYEACHPTSGCYLAEYGLACDDGNLCNGVEACDPETGCYTETLPDAVCNDDNVCNGAEVCDPVIGCHTLYPPMKCDDGNLCNGQESCDTKSGCASGVPLICNDGNPCTLDWCDPITGCRYEYCPDGETFCIDGLCTDDPWEDGGASACCAVGEAGCPADDAVEACVCAEDPSCCELAWGTHCTALAGLCGAACAEACTPSEAPGLPSDPAIEACVCDELEACCTNAWGHECVVAAATHCGADCGD